MGAQTNNPYSKATAGESGDNSGGYGVTQTNGKYESVPQVDPGPALSYFSQSGQAEAQGITNGLPLYQAALTSAGQQITYGYEQGNQELQGLSSV